MSTRTRSFLIGSALVMTVGLCTGLVAYYNGGVGRGDLPSTELAYMPADLGVVGYADVRAMMNSEFRQRIKQVLPTGEELERMKTEIGIDIERDIDTVVAGFSGSSPDHPRRDRPASRPVQRRPDRDDGHAAWRGRGDLSRQAAGADAGSDESAAASRSSSRG